MRCAVFGVDPIGGRFNVTKLGPILEELYERLAGVVIECLRWADFIARYDRPGTLFYLDPPYWGSERDYGAGLFSKADYPALLEALKGLRGRFIITLNDVPEVRRIFSGFSMTKARLTYSVSAGCRTSAAELIITRRRYPNRHARPMADCRTVNWRYHAACRLDQRSTG